MMLLNTLFNYVSLDKVCHPNVHSSRKRTVKCKQEENSTFINGSINSSSVRTLKVLLNVKQQFHRSFAQALVNVMLMQSLILHFPQQQVLCCTHRSDKSGLRFFFSQMCHWEVSCRLGDLQLPAIGVECVKRYVLSIATLLQLMHEMTEALLLKFYSLLPLGFRLHLQAQTAEAAHTLLQLTQKSYHACLYDTR